jgi:hypothetical protein
MKTTIKSPSFRPLDISLEYAGETQCVLDLISFALANDSWTEEAEEVGAVLIRDCRLALEGKKS